MLDGNQLVVIGGLTTGDVICEQPGVFVSPFHGDGLACSTDRLNSSLTASLSQVLNISSMAWQTSYRANTVFSTPELVAQVAGGIGTGFSSSGSGSTTGGTGADDPDTSGSSGGGGSDSGGNSGGGGGGGNGMQTGDGGGGGGSNTGAIAGGVVGGVVGAAAIAAFIFFAYRRRNQKRKAEAQEEKRKLGPGVGMLGGRTNSDSSTGRDDLSHEKFS